MGNVKHTPGPWSASAGGIIVETAKPSFLVAEAFSGRNSAQEANARLIAAAPDLLEALQAINAHWDSGNFSRQAHLWNDMRAAIAKALGQ